MPGIRLAVNRKLCMGAGECVYSAPKTFALDSEEKAIILNPEGDTTEAIQVAVKGCPNFAIRVYKETENAEE